VNVGKGVGVCVTVSVEKRVEVVVSRVDVETFMVGVMVCCGDSGPHAVKATNIQSHRNKKWFDFMFHLFNRKLSQG
jgi:hypothetical protein